ncbi:MAG: FAD/NAD(P)-binding protein [Planctomycetaceae bacterium]|nr:FAD/NAD(P)-binding protein [Planctomycetaceae bacterium]
MTPFPAANPWETESVVIEDVVDELDGIATYQLRPLNTAEGACRFAPGQFNMLYLPGVGEAAISMSGDPAHVDRWTHTVRVAGNVTKTLASLKPGDQLGVRGPFGVGWPLDELWDHDVILVTGGVGLAPLRPLIYHMLRHREALGRIWLLNGARTPDGLLYTREYAEWMRQGLSVQLTVDRAMAGWNGHVGVVTLLLDRLRLPEPARTLLITCGPEVMMKYAAASAARRGITDDHIWISLERNMQCAAGLCGHCQLGPAFVCKDGPVFRYDAMRSYLFAEGL